MCIASTPPRPKTGFFMYSSSDNERIVNEIKIVFQNKNFQLDDAMVKKSSKDVYCRICQKILSSAFGVALITSKTPKRSSENIYLEIGLMKAFGKEVIILTDKRSIIASDLNGKGVFPYVDKNGNSRLETVIDDWINEIETDIESWNRFGDIAFNMTHDYENGFELYKKVILYGDFSNPLVNLKGKFNGGYDASQPFSKRFHEDVNIFINDIESLVDSDLEIN